MSGDAAAASKPAETARAVVIRASREADMPSVQRIYAHHVLHGFGSFEEEPPDLAELMRRRAEYLSRRLPYLVAEIDGRVVGYAYAGPWRTRTAYRYTVENSIYVDPAHTKHGIGRRLMTELIAQCTALGFRQMIAVIGDSGNAPSIKLHEAMGFVHAGNLRSVGRKRGRWLDSVMMQRPLGEGADTEPKEKA
ncbi:MAG: N-acetyltransferase family protein [Alphaproteobacteria bacterium]